MILRTKNILLLLFAGLTMISCSTSRKARSFHQQTITKNDSAISNVDTSKKIEVLQKEQSLFFGDTLSGSLQFSDEQINAGELAHYASFSDSLESTGIKVLLQVSKTPNGLKTKIKAISKPKETINKTISIVEQNNGIAQIKEHKSSNNITTDESQKDKHGSPLWEKILGGIVLLLIILLIIYKKFY